MASMTGYFTKKRLVVFREYGGYIGETCYVSNR